MLVKRFEDLQCWQAAREMTKHVYGLTRNVPFRRDHRLVDQITGAYISAMNNIAEGFDSRSKVESRRFYGYARRTCSEVQSCIYIALDCGYIIQEQFEAVYGIAEKTRRLTSAWSKSVFG